MNPKNFKINTACFGSTLAEEKAKILEDKNAIKCAMNCLNDYKCKTVGTSD